MTWHITISGHDNLDSEAKVAYEQGLVEKARQLTAELASGGVVSSALATTNTTGTVDLTDSISGSVTTEPIVAEPIIEPASDTEGPSGLGVPAVAQPPLGQGLASTVPAGAEVEPDTEGL